MRVKQLCYKNDGGRFDQANTTLKLVNRADYHVSFDCTPPSTVELAELRITNLPGHTPLQLPLESRQDSGSSCHACTWRAELPTSKKNTRLNIEFDLNIQEFGCVTVPVQAKAYEEWDKALAHGSRLRYVQYIFKRTSDCVVLASSAYFGLP